MKEYTREDYLNALGKKVYVLNSATLGVAWTMVEIFSTYESGTITNSCLAENDFSGLKVEGELGKDIFLSKREWLIHTVRTRGGDYNLFEVKFAFKRDNGKITVKIRNIVVEDLTYYFTFESQEVKNIPIGYIFEGTLDNEDELIMPDFLKFNNSLDDIHN